MNDSLGLLFVGLTVLLLAASLWGFRRREHFAAQASAWDGIRVSVEKELQSVYELDLAAFRKKVLDQHAFFEEKGEELQKLEAALGVPMGQPEVSEVKNTNRLFDEKIRLLGEERAAQKKKSQFAGMHTTDLALASLKTLAKVYMIENADTKPKTGVLSNILG